MAKTDFLTIDDLRGGLNSYDPPLSIPQNQTVEAVNVDWSQGSLAHKRAGTVAVSTTGSGLSTYLISLLRHTPTADETGAELWAVDINSVVGRYSGGAWATVTPSDVATSPYTRGASLNGKFFLAYDSAVDRLHVWDGTILRRAGVAPPSAAPTVNNGGSGSYPAVQRWYKQADCVQAAGVTIRRSELTAAVAFTPSGTGAYAVVTKGATPSGESTTHWELYASADNLNFYRIATTVVGTTTYNDSALVSTYSANPLCQVAGLNIPMVSPKFLLCDENRLLGAGAYETAAYASRVFWTPVFGAGAGTGSCDEERVVNTTTCKNYLDLDIADGGGIVGLGGPINGSPYVFKYSQIYKLVRTGKSAAAYAPVTVSKTVGSIRQETIVEGIDATGMACLYFLAADGPRRISSVEGLQWLGNDIWDLWKTINLNSEIPAHGVYDKALHQVWWWIATGASTSPDTVIVFDVRLGKTTMYGAVQEATFGVTQGWSKFTGGLAVQRCSVMFANTLGALVSHDLVPYFGSGTNLLNKVSATATDDAGVLFQAWVKTKPLMPNGLSGHCGITDARLAAKAASGVTIRVTVDRDFGVETRYVDVVLTPAASETRVIKKVDDFSMAGATALQFQFGDAAAVSNAWTLDAFVARQRMEEDV